MLLFTTFLVLAMIGMFVGMAVLTILRALYRPVTKPRLQPSRDTNRMPATQSTRSTPYERIPHLLTAAERDFHAVLASAAPTGFTIMAQVRLANLVQVQQWARRNNTHFYRIQAKCVDFVFCEASSFAPRLVVELDDSSHNAEHRRQRDAFVDEVLAGVGLPMLHVRWQPHYDALVLGQQIRSALGLAISMPAIALASVSPDPMATPTPESIWRPIPPPRIAPAFIPAAAQASHYVCSRCQTKLRPQARFCAQCGATFSVGV